MSDEALNKIRSKSNVNSVKIYVKFWKKKNMNVYIYEGKDRYTATKSLIPKNAQALVNNTYEINIDRGMLIIAYPDKDVMDTEFQFSYWIAPINILIEEEESTNLAAIIIPSIFLPCYICCCFCYIRELVHNKVQPTTGLKEQSANFGWDVENVQESVESLVIAGTHGEQVSQRTLLDIQLPKVQS